MSFYGFKIWHRRLHGLYRARRRCSRGRFASLIPVGLAPDIPFTRPWAAMRSAVKEDNYICADETYHKVLVNADENAGKGSGKSWPHISG